MMFFTFEHLTNLFLVIAGAAIAACLMTGLIIILSDRR